MKIYNPATGTLITSLRSDSAKSVRKKYGILREGQKAWGRRTLAQRIARLKKYGRLLEKNKEELSRDLTLEVGKPLREACNEINGAISRLQFFLSHSKKWLSPERVHQTSGMKELLVFEPLGVTAHISAWNYPYLIATNVLVPALIAGNAVLYKPSEFSTLAGLHMQRLLRQAGVPPDVFQAVVGGGGQGKALVDLPLDGYFFTGSCRTGQSIAKALSGRRVPITLEMGGKDPLYVTEDIKDVDRVAAGAVEGSFYNGGQSCCAVERIYVHQKIYDAFVRAFLREVKKLRPGDPLREGTTLGPVTRRAHLAALTAQVKDAVRRGATLLAGGRPITGPGFFFEPTVLVKVNHTMRVMREETFGPVIGIQKVRNDEEALSLMKDTPYGLTASVYSRSEKRARRILEKLDVGTGYWNCCDRVSPFLPWSGRKNSGCGVTLSYLGIRAFVKPKAYLL